MKILLNNSFEIIDTDYGVISINDILQQKKHIFKALNAKVNGKNISKNYYNAPLVKENYIVDIIY